MRSPFFTPQISQRNKARGNLYWSLSYQDEFGNVGWISLKTKDKRVAQARRDQAIREGMLAEQAQKKPAPFLVDAAKGFLSSIEIQRCREPGTVRAYTPKIAMLVDWLVGKGLSRIDEVTPQIAAEFTTESARYDKFAVGTKRAAITVWRAFFSWCMETYDIPPRNPFAKIRAPKGKPKEREFWTVEQCENIISHARNAETAAFFALQAYMGLRVSEAQRLPSSAIVGTHITVHGKGGKIAKLPISSRLRHWLSIWERERGSVCRFTESPLLFPSLGSLRKNPKYLLTEAAKLAGLENEGAVHFHRFRHSLVSNSLNKYGNIKAAQILARHENVTLTLNIYGHLLPTHLEESVEL